MSSALRSVFRTPQGGLRATWLVVLFLLVCVASIVVAWGLVAPILLTLVAISPLGPVSVEPLVLAVALLAAHAVMFRIDRGSSWGDVGLQRGAAKPGTLLHGFALGGIPIAIPVIVLIALGWLQREVGDPVSPAGALTRVTIVLLAAAFAEELLMRGYLFSVIRRAIGPLTALVATSVIFALIHLQNAGASAWSLFFVALAGLFLGSVLLITGSLYAAWMAHFAWNWTMAVLFRTPVSGLPLEAPGYRYVDAGPDWATGGEWGPEGSVLAGIGMLGAIGYLYARRSRRREN